MSDQRPQRPSWRERLNLAARALRGAPPPARRLPAIVAATKGVTQAKQVQPIAAGRVTPPPALVGGRQTQPVNVNPFGLTGYNWVWKREYQNLDLSELNTGLYEAGQLLSILADLSPDVSRAAWNKVRIAGTGLAFHVTTPAGKDDAKGQALVDALVARLNPKAGGIDTLIVQLILTAYLQGAICLEVAPTEDLRGVQDLFPVNPVTIYYQRDITQTPVPFQRQSVLFGTGVAPYRRMNEETFFYTPIDPYVDDVYGRSPAAPSLQVVFFQTQVMRDLERVIHAQGWPRIDISVVSEILRTAMPKNVRDDASKAAAWTTARMNEIVGAYNTMAPEDAFVHEDYVVVSSDAAKAGANMFDPEKLLRVIRLQLISALKELPALMGEHLGSTETYSTVEMLVYAQTIDAFRVPVGRMLARGLEVALQLMGHVATVEESWPAVALLDRLAVALADAQEATNEAYKRDQGWIDQDQASEAITGSAAVADAPASSLAPPQAPAPSAVIPPKGEKK